MMLLNIFRYEKKTEDRLMNFLLAFGISKKPGFNLIELSYRRSWKSKSCKSVAWEIIENKYKLTLESAWNNGQQETSVRMNICWKQVGTIPWIIAEKRNIWCLLTKLWKIFLIRSHSSSYSIFLLHFKHFKEYCMKVKTANEEFMETVQVY